MKAGSACVYGRVHTTQKCTLESPIWLLEEGCKCDSQFV